MKIKVFCRCGLFPSWSGKGLISTPALIRHRTTGSIPFKTWPFTELH